MNLLQEIDLDGHYDSVYNGTNENKACIKYIGKGKLQSNGKYKVLADVNGSLCLVEVSLALKDL